MNDLVVSDTQQYAIMPVMDTQMARVRRQAIIDFTRSVMVVGTDYGEIPGTSKPTLLKPGAEKLTTLFGLSPHFEIVDKVEDWTGDQHGGEPLFRYLYRCTLYRGNLVVGQGDGECNSWEKKYRYRSAEITCPNCGKATVIKGKAEFGGGWLCWGKKGGCGSKWGDGAPEIESQPRGDVPNPNPQDLVNTISKMAQKRALVAATLIAVNASEFFTQDVEDMDLGQIIEGEIVTRPEANQRPTSPAPARRKAGRPAPPPMPADQHVEWDDLEPAKPTNGNGNGNNGPLPDDEVVIAETPAKGFIAASAALLDMDEEQVKATLKAAGWTAVPRDTAKRLDAYRQLRSGVQGVDILR